MPQPSRRRLSYLALVALVIALGLASRAYSSVFPEAVRQYLGDALWALMVMLLIGVLVPALSTLRLVLVAIAVAFAVEFSQLIRWSWLLSLRQHPLGHLALGSSFHPPDLLAYTLGVGLGAVLETWLKALRPFKAMFFVSASAKAAA